MSALIINLSALIFFKHAYFFASGMDVIFYRVTVPNNEDGSYRWLFRQGQ